MNDLTPSLRNANVCTSFRQIYVSQFSCHHGCLPDSKLRLKDPRRTQKGNIIRTHTRIACHLGLRANIFTHTHKQDRTPTNRHTDRHAHRRTDRHADTHVHAQIQEQNEKQKAVSQTNASKKKAKAGRPHLSGAGGFRGTILPVHLTTKLVCFWIG